MRHVMKSFEHNALPSNLNKSDVHSQMMPFTKLKLKNLLCGFREGYSTQHVLLRLVER